MPKTLRPGDLLRKPLDSPEEKEPGDNELPPTWKNAIQDARKWPFVDPDVMLEEKTESFNDFPSEPPTEIIPYSEYEPWGKTEEESGRDHELFRHYLAEGLSRSYAGTARAFGISQPYISKVANKHDWPDRARAWDLYREKIYTSTVIERTKKMADDHADIAAKGIRALAMVFDEIVQRAEEDPEGHKEELREMSFRGLFALADKAARALPNLMNAERLSRGLPTELTADIQVKENRVVVQSTEELSEVVLGLFNALSSAGNEEEGSLLVVEDAEVIEEEE